MRRIDQPRYLSREPAAVDSRRKLTRATRLARDRVGSRSRGKSVRQQPYELPVIPAASGIPALEHAADDLVGLTHDYETALAK